MKTTHFSTTRGLVAALSLLAIGALPQSARADVVYSTFGPGNSFSGSSGYDINGSGIFLGYREQAMRFTPSSSFTLTSVDVGGVTFMGGGTTNFQVVNDASGRPGSTVIASGTITFTGTASIKSFVASGAVNAGTNYWLTGSPVSSDSSVLWLHSTPVVNGMVASRSSTVGVWSISSGTQSAFRINGTLLSGSAPEPGTLALLALGMVGGVVARRRK